MIARLWALSAIVFAIVLLPACGEPPRGVVVWHPYNGGEQKAVLDLARTFEKEHGVKVTLLAVPYGAYVSKLEAAIPRGNGPDVFLGPHNTLGEYRTHLVVAPVGDALPDAEVERFEALALDAVTLDGQRWGVPLATKCAALFVNTKLVPEAPRTLEEIVASKATLPRGVTPLVYETQNVYYHAALLHAFGGELFDAKRGFAMVGEGAEKSLVKARDLTTAGIVPDEADGALVKQLFLAGQAATAISGPWLVADLPASHPYRVVPLPTIEGAGPMRPFLTVEAAFLTPEGAKRDVARSFARFLASDASALVRATEGNQVPSTKKFWEEKRSETLTAFHDASANAVLMSSSSAVNPAWDPAKQALRKVLRGAASPGEALDEAKARYDAVMRPPPEAASGTPLLVVAGLVLMFLAWKVARRASAPGFKSELRASMPAYRYVLHSAAVIAVLVVLPLVAGAFTSLYAGTRESPRFVGLANYVDILTAQGKPLLSHGSFYLTLLVTILWTALNVAAHVGIGLVLGVALARPLLRMRAAYRVLLVIPWAVPSYVTALAWKGMFHRQFGAVNAVLVWLGAEPISWFAKWSTAFTANVATNVWLGFPFMMVVVMGALTSIPKDVLEAAEVDGATRWQRFARVTLPLLKPTLLPAVVLGSVWTFNMFNVVFLVSGGEPDGTTDILVSEAYRWAFTRNSQFGMAAAYAVVIFVLLLFVTRVFGREEAGRA